MSCLFDGHYFPWITSCFDIINETFSTLLALCEGFWSGGLISQRPVTQSFDVFFDLRLSEQSRRQRFEPPLHSLWCHCNEYLKMAELSAAVFPVITCLLLTVWPRRHLMMMVRDIHQVGVVNTTKKGTIMSLVSKLFSLSLSLHIYIYRWFSARLQ